MSELYREITECRVCSSPDVISFLDLGEMPPANGFVTHADEAEHTFPLVVSVCSDCHHVQLQHTVDREFLFSEYHYFSSTSTPLQDHFAEYAEMVERKYLSDDDFVVEIGSNDGVLLQNFSEYERLGIEPAANVAEAAEKRGIPTRVDFFSEDVAESVRNQKRPAKAIMANNVVGHIDDLQSLMRGVDTLLAEDGTFVVEVPYFVDLYNGNEFDTIYHEHISYFSVNSFVTLANKHDFLVSDVQRKSVHGGTIRVHIQRDIEGTERSPMVEDLLCLERAIGLTDVEAYHEFSSDVEATRRRIRNLLTELSESGHKIVGYGAPAKGNVLLNYCGLGTDVLDFIIDTTPKKQGTFTPGTNIPVYPPEKMEEERPDYAFLLAWNYKDAILEKEQEFREEGRFVVPIPNLDIV